MIRRLAPLIAACALLVTAVTAQADNTLALAVTAALKSGDAVNAEALATRALSDSGLSLEDHARLLLNRGLAREQLGRHEEALVDYTEAIQLGVLQPSDHARALFDRGVSLDELGRTSDAIGDYTAALKLNPTFPPALNNRANAYRRTGKFVEAKRDYTASLAANNAQPEYPEYGLGQIAEAQNDLRAAKEWYNKAVAANPKYTLASQRLAELGDFIAPTLKPPTVVAANGMPSAVKGEAATQPVKEKLPPAVETSASTIAPAAFAPPTDAPELRPAIIEAMDDTASASPATNDIAPPSQPRIARGDARQIQLGAWRAEAEAAEGWNHIVSRAGTLLTGMTPQIVVADIPGKGRYWRLRADPVGTSATDLCARLQAVGITCIAVK
jgi:tetratricopeptide (TPR) repeat protein